jgi:hypothetical protein
MEIRCHLLFVCKEHVLKVIKNLNVPHICETDKNIKCRYCDHASQYELYIFDFRNISKN